MNCMRCGKEIPEGQVFCDPCLADMARYPVKPDTPIHLPPPKPPVQQRRQKKRSKRKVDLIRRYRRLSKALAVILALVLIASVVTIGVLVRRLRASEAKQNIGQNYTTTAPNPRRAN